MPIAATKNRSKKHQKLFYSERAAKRFINHFSIFFTWLATYIMAIIDKIKPSKQSTENEIRNIASNLYGDNAAILIKIIGIIKTNNRYIKAMKILVTVADLLNLLIILPILIPQIATVINVEIRLIIIYTLLLAILSIRLLIWAIRTINQEILTDKISKSF